jgi:starch-binding outer membrane protein, SusD/RagB family
MKTIKNIKKIILLCFGFLIIWSCNTDEILNLKPITDRYIDPNNILEDAETAEEAMTAVNAIFGNEYWQFDYFFLGDSGSDVCYAGGDGEDFFQIDQYRTIATDYVVARDWGHLVNHIKRCNLIINNVNNVPDLSQERKDEMIGEASLFRALTRFQAVQIWGDYPIVDINILTVSNDNFNEAVPYLYPTRQPIADVYASIIADCEVALVKAPTSTSAPASKYRASKGAANALLAKVYATMPNPDWAKVIQYSDAVIGGGYSLMPTYDHLFDSAHEGNSESIWEVNGEGQGSTINSWCTNVFLGTNWKKFNTPTHTLSAALDVKRKAATIKKFPTTFADPYWTSFTQFPFPWKMRKTDGTQNFYIFRLADIILIKAEALAHTGDLSGAMTLVNQIRTRITLPNVVPATSMDDAINKILKERFLELALEGQRWFDLKREGKSIEILSQQTYPVYNSTTQTYIETLMPYVGNITNNDLVWPIPQAVLDNNTNLTQNPGY